MEWNNFMADGNGADADGFPHFLFYFEERAVVGSNPITSNLLL